MALMATQNKLLQCQCSGGTGPQWRRNFNRSQTHSPRLL